MSASSTGAAVPFVKRASKTRSRFFPDFHRGAYCDASHDRDVSAGVVEPIADVFASWDVAHRNVRSTQRS